MWFKWFHIKCAIAQKKKIENHGNHLESIHLSLHHCFTIIFWGLSREILRLWCSDLRQIKARDHLGGSPVLGEAEASVLG